MHGQRACFYGCGCNYLFRDMCGLLFFVGASGTQGSCPRSRFVGCGDAACHEEGSCSTGCIGRCTGLGRPASAHGGRSGWEAASGSAPWCSFRAWLPASTWRGSWVQWSRTTVSPCAARFAFTPPMNVSVFGPTTYGSLSFTPERAHGCSLFLPMARATSSPGDDVAAAWLRLVQAGGGHAAMWR